MTILLGELALAPVNGTSSRWHNKIVIPTEAYPDFLPRGTHQQPRMRLSLEKAALTPPTPPVSTGNPAERSGGTCGLLWELALAPVNGTSSRWHNKIFIPTEAYPDFLPRGTHQQPRMRLSLEKAALTPPTPPVSTGNPGERSGGTCGLLWELALAPVNGTSSRWHNKIVIPTEAKRRGGTCGLLWELALAPVNGTSSRWHNKIVIPPAPACRGTGAYPDFLPRGTHQQPRMRLSLEKAALTPLTPPVSTGNPGQRSGGTCGFLPSAGSVVAIKAKQQFPES
jgi:hypothetical protein